jgi:hypothetical protein
MFTGTITHLAPALLLAAALGLGGCNEFSRNSDMQFGTSFHKVFANQKLHPDAGAEGTPVEGFDGQKAVNTMGKYQNKPASPKAAGKGGGSGTTDAMLFTPKDSGKSEN